MVRDEEDGGIIAADDGGGRAIDGGDGGAAQRGSEEGVELSADFELGGLKSDHGAGSG